MTDVNFGNLKGNLMCESTTLVSFEFKNGECVKSDIVDFSKCMPFAFLGKSVITGREFTDFLEDRLTPQTRIGFYEEMTRQGLDHYDAEVLVRMGNGRCASDPFWIKLTDYMEGVTI